MVIISIHKSKESEASEAGEDGKIEKKKVNEVCNKISSECPFGMNEEDMRCYSERYLDVGDMNAREHYE